MDRRTEQLDRPAGAAAAPNAEQGIGPPRTSEATAEPALAPREPRQRLRITFAREPVAPDAVGRVAIEAWSAALAASGLPVSGLEPGGTGRPRFAFAAPLPAASRGLAELVDIWLVERVPVWRVREALSERMPLAHHWVAASDVWLGAPALAGQVVAAVWLVDLDGAAAASIDLAPAVRVVLGASSLQRMRTKGDVERPYDLRPLIIDISAPQPADGRIIRITTRVDPALGAGRPEEVVGALADAAGVSLAIASIVRERLVIADRTGEPPPTTKRVGGGPRRSRP